jgi:hypothetical protein
MWNPQFFFDHSDTESLFLEFNFKYRRNLHGTRFEKNRGLGTTIVWFLARNSCADKAE